MSLIARKLPHLGEAERRLAEYVRGNLHSVAFASARSLATQAGVSAATVVRFFPRLGYMSFGQAQKELQNELSSQFEAPIQRLPTECSPPNSSVSLLSLAQDAQNLSGLATVMRSAEYAQLTTWLGTCHGRISVVGGRYSLGSAQLLTSQLSAVAPTRLINSQDGSATLELLDFSIEDIVLCLSIRRYLRSTATLARWLHGRGVRIVALTDTPSAPLALCSDLVIALPTQGAALFDSYVAFTALGNALVAELCLSRQQITEYRMREVEEIDENLHFYHDRPYQKGKGSPADGSFEV